MRERDDLHRNVVAREPLVERYERRDVLRLAVAEHPRRTYYRAVAFRIRRVTHEQHVIHEIRSAPLRVARHREHTHAVRPEHERLAVDDGLLHRDTGRTSGKEARQRTLCAHPSFDERLLGIERYHL